MSLRLSGGRRLRSPSGLDTRPTGSRVRLAVMNLLAGDLPGCRWLDLCCGSGVMGCEALQRGAASVLAVERDRRMASTARENLEAVAGGLSRLARVEVVCAALPRWLEITAVEPPGFDLIYLDPPYASDLYGPVAEQVAKRGWLAPGGTMLWECGATAIPAVPLGWHLLDQRRYGGTALLLLGR